jgi:transposase, IS30 family
MNYRHLSHGERYQICFLYRLDLGVRAIARELGRNESTISRELTRGRGTKGYRSAQAHSLAQLRARGSRNALRIAAPVWQQVAQLLAIEHSPEQIGHTLRCSAMSIYRHIVRDKAAGGQLYKKLRCQRRVRRRYAAGYGGQGKICNRRDIDERPAHIAKRKRVGHWEADTIVGPTGQGKSVLVSMVERKSGLTRLVRSKNRTAKCVSKAMIAKLKPLRTRVFTVTNDNGHEFALHEKVDASLNTKTYFAHPYASHQRGTVENLNGLVRQYFPKGTNFDDVTDTQIALAEYRLNNRPRKRLNWLTPQQVFDKSFNRVALRK